MILRFTASALRDLDSVLDYISRHSPLGASRVQARIKAVIELLPSHPFIGTRTNDPAIRRMTTSPYPCLIFYEATGSEIILPRHAEVCRGALDCQVQCRKDLVAQ